MPVIGIPVERLNTMLKEPVERDDLLAYVEQLGCDVEGFATVTRFKCRRCGGLTEITERESYPVACDGCGADFTKGDGTAENIGRSEVIRMELLPVRPDMFDVGGLARTLRGYLGLETGAPRYPVSSSGYTVTVDEKVKRPRSYRPNIVCAVVRGLPLDQELIKIVMKMQENLHWALGRDRKKASIGVYDLGTVEPDFRYTTLADDEIRFVPLGGMPDDANGDASPLEILEHHPKGTAYRHLLADFDRFPILMDAKGTVLSMPPIINSEETRVSETTKDFFIDVTGPDAVDVHRALNTLVCSLAEFGGTIETVNIITSEGKAVTPDLGTQRMDLDPEQCARLIGVDLTTEEVTQFLRRMRHDVRSTAGHLAVEIPAYRTDIMHPVDLIEDVAIAFGYHNIKRSLVPNMTVGRARLLETACGMARRTMLGLGFMEVITFMLTNPEDQYTKLLLDQPDTGVLIENPATVEQTMVRTHLVTGLLETFRLNRSQPMPQKIFEIGDVCRLDPEEETGTEDIRKICGAVMDPRTGFAEIKSIIESLVREIGYDMKPDPADEPFFISGRCARLMAGGDCIGFLGEIDPQVLENFDLVQPVSLFELTFFRDKDRK